VCRFSNLEGWFPVFWSRPNRYQKHLVHAVTGALSDEAPLELGEGAEEVKDQFAGSRRGVELLFQ
jgi:hypothetical protein